MAENVKTSGAVANGNQQNAKSAPKKDKKPNIFVRFWNKIKEIFSELKKVTWPTFGKTVTQTGAVLVVVVVFLIVITAFDSGLSQLFKLLTGIN